MNWYLLGVEMNLGQASKTRFWYLLGVTWDQDQFSYRFVSNIPAGEATNFSCSPIRENLWEPLKLGLISGYLGAFSKFSDEHLRHFYRGVPPGLKWFLQKINYFPGINRTQVSRDFAAFIDYHYTWLRSTVDRQRFNISFSILARKSGFYLF